MAQHVRGPTVQPESGTALFLKTVPRTGQLLGRKGPSGKIHSIAQEGAYCNQVLGASAAVLGADHMGAGQGWAQAMGWSHGRGTSGQVGAGEGLDPRARHEGVVPRARHLGPVGAGEGLVPRARHLGPGGSGELGRAVRLGTGFATGL